LRRRFPRSGHIRRRHPTLPRRQVFAGRSSQAGLCRQAICVRHALPAECAPSHRERRTLAILLAAAPVRADYRSSYRKETAEDAWNQMRTWLKKYNGLSCRAQYRQKRRGICQASFRKQAIVSPSRSGCCCDATWTSSVRPPRSSIRMRCRGRQRRPGTARSDREL
jgi:hypothetical protein